MWQAPTHTKRHPWCLMSLQKYLPPPNSTKELQSHLTCMPTLSSSSPGCPPECLGAERHICTPTSHGVCWLSFQCHSLAGDMQRGKCCSKGSPHAAAGWLLHVPFRSTESFCPWKVCKGDLSRVLGIHGAKHPTVLMHRII